MPAPASAGRPGDVGAAQTIGASVAEGLSHGASPPVLAQVARELDRLDQAVYAAVATTPSPTIDEALRRLTRSADGGRLWLAVAALLAVAGGPAGRRAAGRGVAALGLSSLVVNAALKPLAARARPARPATPSPRHVPMPSSTSFPSGHAASAAAFAGAVAAEGPVLAVPLRILAALTAYSRVHAGVHYPGDVVVGAVVGALAGDVVRHALRR